MHQQIVLFIFSILSGVLLGVFFDCYRIIRGFNNPNKLVTAMEDILFWILAGILIFIFMMYTNYAYISFNVVIYGIMGLFLYLKLFSTLFIKIVYNIVVTILTIARLLIYRVTYPFRIIFYKLTEKK